MNEGSRQRALMLSDKLKELEVMRNKISVLEAQISADITKELRELPSRYGFPDVPSFSRAVREATGSRMKRRKGNAAAKAGSKRKRAKITDEMRAEVKKLVEAGKSGKEIAEMVGVSVPSVQNIKKALGLAKRR